MSINDGQSSHTKLTADMWCVTKADFQSLRNEISDAIRQGKIIPTKRDKFDKDDNVIGPNFYTINEQFIKPITSLSGNASWALMKHPEGRKCDIFISHAWEEGIFEFVDKVLCSWPRTAEHAWCCLLANPQNLDISDLIASPSTSPFAIALRSAKHVLVVPNSKCSVYSRLWCVYEAFVAYQQEKLITTARSPRWREQVFASGIAFACFMIGAVARALVHKDASGSEIEMHLYRTLVEHVIVPVSILVRHCQVRCIVNLCGVLLCGAAVLHAAETHNAFSFYLYTAVFFIVAECDRTRTKSLEIEARLLQQDWAGCAGASCSDERDRSRIHDDIGDSSAEVDRTIQVLMHASMSTEMLRRVQAAGVNVYQAAHVEYAFLFWSYALIPIDICYVIKDNDALEIVVPTAVLWCLQLCWLIVYCGQQSDAQALSIRIQQKVFTAGIFILLLLESGSLAACGQFYVVDKTPATYQWVHATAWLIVLVISIVGIHNVALIPGCGRRLAEFLVARVDTGWCVDHRTDDLATLDQQDDDTASEFGEEVRDEESSPSDHEFNVK